MVDKNVRFNHTLKQYNKRYRHHKNLLKFTKKEVEEFDRQANTVGEHYVLRKHKWWFIDDTYYQVPKKLGAYWFRNLNVGVQTAICLLGAGVIATGASMPKIIELFNKNNSGEVIIDPSKETQAKIVVERTTEAGTVYKVTAKDTTAKKITSIEAVYIGEDRLKENEEYTYEPTKDDAVELTIMKAAFSNHKGTVKVKPVVKDKEEPTPEVTITLDKHTATMKVGDTLQLNATVTGTTKKVFWGVTSESNFACSVDQTGLVTAKSKGTCVITAGVEGKQDRCTITVEDEPAPKKTATVDYTDLQYYLLFEKNLNITIAQTSTNTISNESVTSSTISIEYTNLDGADKKFNLGVYGADGTLLEEMGEQTFTKNNDPIEITFTKWGQITSGDTLSVKVIEVQEKTAIIDYSKLQQYFADKSIPITISGSTSSISKTSSDITLNYTNTGVSKTFNIGVHKADGTLIQGFGERTFDDEPLQLTFTAWNDISSGDTLYFDIVQKTEIDAISVIDKDSKEMISSLELKVGDKKCVNIIGNDTSETDVTKSCTVDTGSGQYFTATLKDNSYYEIEGTAIGTENLQFTYNSKVSTSINIGVVKSAKVEYNDAGFTDLGLSTTATSSELTETKPIKFTVKNNSGTPDNPFDIYIKDKDNNEIYRATGSKIPAVGETQDFIINTTDIKTWESLADKNTLTVYAEATKTAKTITLAQGTTPTGYQIITLTPTSFTQNKDKEIAITVYHETATTINTISIAKDGNEIFKKSYIFTTGSVVCSIANDKLDWDKVEDKGSYTVSLSDSQEAKTIHLTASCPQGYVVSSFFPSENFKQNMPTLAFTVTKSAQETTTNHISIEKDGIEVFGKDSTISSYQNINIENSEIDWEKVEDNGDYTIKIGDPK